MAQTFDKDPDATLDYAIDWSRWLTAGDSIRTSVWSAPTPLVVEAESASSTQAIVWLSGGEGGKRYTVVNTITTTNGRKDQRSFVLNVKDR